MERLTEWFDDEQKYEAEIEAEEFRGLSELKVDKIVQKLGYYEDLEEQCRMLILPVAEGATVYEIVNNTDACADCKYFERGYYGCDDWCDNPNVRDEEGNMVWYPQYKDFPVCEKHFLEVSEFKPNLDWIFKNRNDFGKTWFLTSEEANAELTKLKNKE